MASAARISIDVEVDPSYGYCTTKFFEAVAEGTVELLNKRRGQFDGITFSLAPEPVERLVD